VEFIISSRKIFWIVCLGLAATVVGASADGAYQRTKDGRTIVWNDNPKPGDAATWTGKRDRDGYASGFGTLTWYTTRPRGSGTKESVFAAFFGNMIRGKLDGPVNGHSKGVTNHAMFKEGKRSTQWAGGPVPSWRMPEGVDVAKPAEASPIAARVEPPRPAGFNPPPPSYQPPGKNRPIPNYESIQQRTAGEAEDIPAEGPPGNTPSAGPRTTPHKKLTIEIDESLLALTGPPPSLGKNAEANSSRKRRFDRTERSRLGKHDVLGAADAAARDRGYNITQYQRDEPQFDAIDRTWVVSYEPKSQAERHFTVAIDDNTGRTAVVGPN
jgi:hypothetical protein